MKKARADGGGEVKHYPTLWKYNCTAVVAVPSSDAASHREFNYLMLV